MVNVGKVDWGLLAKQKVILCEFLLESDIPAERLEAIEGIVNLIDDIQDQVADSGQVHESEVFPGPRG